jgi:hypothetical protein
MQQNDVLQAATVSSTNSFHFLLFVETPLMSLYMISEAQKIMSHRLKYFNLPKAFSAFSILEQGSFMVISLSSLM